MFGHEATNSPDLYKRGVKKHIDYIHTRKQHEAVINIYLFSHNPIFTFQCDAIKNVNSFQEKRN